VSERFPYQASHIGKTNTCTRANRTYHLSNCLLASGQMASGSQSATPKTPQNVHQVPRSLPTASHPHNQSNHSSFTTHNYADGDASHTLAVVLPRLTETNLDEHNHLYDEAGAAFQIEVRTIELQETGSKLGFDLPLHRCEHDQWHHQDWIEEQALRVHQCGASNARF
jgi:hypothetical protein